MASAKRDYYDVLGVPRDADEALLKKAFRRLARELHPDVSDDPAAEARFREVAEAYEVLSKAETRELYDRFGHEGLRSGGYRPPDMGDLSDLFSHLFGGDLLGDLFGSRRQRARRGADVAIEVQLELAEVAAGARREVVYAVAAVCSTCDGSGAEPGSTPATCPACDGAGRFQAVSNTLLGQMVRTQLCGRCHGAGRVVTELCPTCDGEGAVRDERRLEVEVPPGIADGQRIRLSGRGHTGGAGAAPGDLYVLVHVLDDPRFVRDGDDLVSRLDVPMTLAALGGQVTVPTLDGQLEVELAPGTQPGAVVVLRGKGLPALRGRGRGDQRVLVNVRVPRRLSDEQRRLLEELDRVTDPAADDEDDEGDGFFDRLRAAFR